VRILLAVHYWLPHLGGVELEARQQALLLRERGHQVSVITSRLDGDPEFELDEGIEVHRVRALNTLERRLGLPYPLFDPRVLGVARRLVAESDVVIGHTHTFLSTVAAARAAKRLGVPFVLIQNNPYIDYPFPLSLVQKAADITLGRYSTSRATRLVAISEFTADYVRRLAPGRPVEVMYLGVDVDRFSPVTPSERRAIRIRLNLEPDAFIAFTVRRLFFRNGVDTLLEAAALLRDRTDIRVVIGGSGPDRAEMDDQIVRDHLDHVTLAGFIPDDDLADYHRAADVFVLPSRTAEGFGLVLLEAAACSVPSIATRSGAPPELIDDGETGLLVPTDSPDELAAAIARLADDHPLAVDMGAAAYARHGDQTWQRSVDQLEAILIDAVAEGRG